jgi:hypothetical protein
MKHVKHKKVIEAKPCPPGKVRNPATNRCKKVGGDVVGDVGGDVIGVVSGPEELWKSNDKKVWKAIIKNSKVSKIPKLQEKYTKEDHIELLKLKMSRGQWRPLLMKYANELDDKVVIETYAKARDADGYKEKIKILSKLKGVGVAFATIYLSIEDPKNFPFMSDDLLALVGIDKPKYSLIEYEKVIEGVRAKSKELGGMKCADIEHAVYTARNTGLKMQKKLI